MANFCRQCGNPLSDGDRFCAKCGTAVAKVAEPCPGDRDSLRESAWTSREPFVGNMNRICGSIRWF
ncbi:MAG: zinc ribbon domain-containing protein [Selenomonadaceae bacterium]|nr:zinc ribbon domain-containing protein [Selenomonadaceae bacterium]